MQDNNKENTASAPEDRVEGTKNSVWRQQRRVYGELRRRKGGKENETDTSRGRKGEGKEGETAER